MVYIGVLVLVAIALQAYTIYQHKSQTALLAVVFTRLNKLEHLENLFIKYEASINLAADAADKLNKQQERLETLYQFNTKAVAVVKEIAKQRSTR